MVDYNQEARIALAALCIISPLDFRTGLGEDEEDNGCRLDVRQETEENNEGSVKLLCKLVVSTPDWVPEGCRFESHS